MCFRPVNAAKPIECPNCHKKTAPMAGVTPKNCPFCGAEMPKSNQESTKK
jgi:hypothetical protein